jgi:hypothetical protein
MRGAINASFIDALAIDAGMYGIWRGVSAYSQGAHTLAAVGAVGIVGAGAYNQEQSLTSVGAAGIVGVGAYNQEQSLASVGAAGIAGVCAYDQGAHTLLAVGKTGVAIHTTTSGVTSHTQSGTVTGHSYSSTPITRH